MVNSGGRNLLLQHTNRSRRMSFDVCLRYPGSPSLVRRRLITRCSSNGRWTIINRRCRHHRGVVRTSCRQSYDLHAHTVTSKLRPLRPTAVTRQPITAEKSRLPLIYSRNTGSGAWLTTQPRRRSLTVPRDVFRSFYFARKYVELH